VVVGLGVVAVPVAGVAVARVPVVTGVVTDADAVRLAAVAVVLALVSLALRAVPGRASRLICPASPAAAASEVSKFTQAGRRSAYDHVLGPRASDLWMTRRG